MSLSEPQIVTVWKKIFKHMKSVSVDTFLEFVHVFFITKSASKPLPWQMNCENPFEKFIWSAELQKNHDEHDESDTFPCLHGPGTRVCWPHMILDHHKMKTICLLNKFKNFSPTRSTAKHNWRSWYDKLISQGAVFPESGIPWQNHIY